jgi:hypothetical protein
MIASSNQLSRRTKIIRGETIQRCQRCSAEWQNRKLLMGQILTDKLAVGANAEPMRGLHRRNPATRCSLWVIRVAARYGHRSTMSASPRKRLDYCVATKCRDGPFPDSWPATASDNADGDGVPRSVGNLLREVFIQPFVLHFVGAGHGLSFLVWLAAPIMFRAYMVFSWPALAVFIWLPLFALGILIARLLTPLSWIVGRTQWFLKEGKEHPLKAIGYVAAVVVFLGTVVGRAVFSAL